MIIMSGIVLFILLFVTSGSIFGKPEEDKELSYRFQHEDYFYYLTDEQIEKAINKGVETLQSIDRYLLPVEKCSLVNETDILFAYIEPPSLTATNMARNIYHQYKRKVRTSEVKEKLMDEYLPFVVRFSEDEGYLYEIEMVQDGQKIFPYKTEVKNNGGLSISYFRVEDLKFTQDAFLHVIDQINEDSEKVYHIDFSLYVFDE